MSGTNGKSTGYQRNDPFDIDSIAKFDDIETTCQIKIHDQRINKKKKIKKGRKEKKYFIINFDLLNL